MIIAIYKVVGNGESIMREIQRPSSITKFWKYFDRLELNVNGRKCNAGIKFAFDVHEEAFEEEVEYEYRQNGIYLWKKSI